MPGALANLGHVYFFCGDPQLGLLHYRKALAAEQKQRDDRGDPAELARSSSERAERDTTLLDTIRADLLELSRSFPRRRRAARAMRRKLLEVAASLPP